MSSPSTGSALLAHLLAEHGVDVVAGVLDASFGDLAVALDDHDVRRVAPSTEGAAVHMAAAWSHTTGRPGVAFVASAPGLAHALPAMADAQQTGDRVLVVSSSRRVGVTGPHREGLVAGLDNAAVTASLVKWSARVPSADRLAELFRAAMRAMWTGRPGVVHLDVPTSVLSGLAPRSLPAPDPAAAEDDWWRVAPRPGAAAAAAGMLVRARLPVLHLGRGVLHSRADEQVRQLVSTLEAGVTTTWGARGVVAEDDLHVIPPTHPGVVDDLRKDADVVLVLGADLGESDWWGQPPHWGPVGEQTVIQVDIDPSAIGRNRVVDLGIAGDVGLVLDQVIAEVDALGDRDTVPRRHMLGDHRSAVRRGRANLNEPLVEAERTPIHPAAAVVAARLAMPDDAVWVFDGGHTRRWGQFHVPAMHPRAQFGVGPLEMTGGGVAQALGAKLAAPDRTVCAIMGDGAFARQLGELPTSLAQGLPFVAVVLVDGYAGPVDATAGSDRGLAVPESAEGAGMDAEGAGREGVDPDGGGAPEDGATNGEAPSSGPDRTQRRRGRRGGRRSGGRGADQGSRSGEESAAAAGAKAGQHADSPEADGADAASRDGATAGAAGEPGNGHGPDSPADAPGDADLRTRAVGRPSVAIRSLRDLSSGVQADPVRYDLVARGLGAWGEFVDHPGQLGPALERARAASRLAVVHVSVDRVEHTWTPEAGMFRTQRAPAAGSPVDERP